MWEIIFFFGVCFLFVQILIFFTNDKEMKILLILFTIVLFLAISLLAYLEPIEEYKQGQIDAMTGKVKYELQTQNDSTRIWVEIEGD